MCRVLMFVALGKSGTSTSRELVQDEKAKMPNTIEIENLFFIALFFR